MPGSSSRAPRGRAPGATTTSGPIRATADHPTTGARGSTAPPGSSIRPPGSTTSTLLEEAAGPQLGQPRAPARVYAMMRWWLERGIDGFRMDVINFIAKHARVPRLGAGPRGARRALRPRARDRALRGTRPAFTTTCRRCHREVLAHYDVMTVGECHYLDPARAVRYVAPLGASSACSSSSIRSSRAATAPRSAARSRTGTRSSRATGRGPRRPWATMTSATGFGVRRRR
jgi:hypothetical protein